MDIEHAADLLARELVRKRTPHILEVAPLYLHPADKEPSLCVKLSRTDVSSIRDVIGDVPPHYDRHVVHLKIVAPSPVR